MKSFLLLILFIEIVGAAKKQTNEWHNFKLMHEKVYQNRRDENRHLKAFRENQKIIARHNRQYSLGKVNFTLGFNKYSDMTFEQFSKIMLMEMKYVNRTFPTTIFKQQHNFQAPPSIDWREQGYVTPVKDQGQCGSCYAFSAVGGLEGQHFKKTGQLISLSEQNIMDCSHSFGNGGCKGGSVQASYNYIANNTGIDTEAAYPYVGIDQSCRYTPDGKGSSCTGFLGTPPGDEIALRDALATVGPIPASFYVTKSFTQFSSGIYYGQDCPESGTNHAILIVGYGSSNGDDYWIVKNSWGRSFGEDGYFRMARNRNSNCQIADNALYPTL